MLYSIPLDIINYIYCFDDTFKKNYDRVIDEINYNYRYKYFFDYIKYINIFQYKYIIYENMKPSLILKKIKDSNIQTLINFEHTNFMSIYTDNILEKKDIHFFNWILNNMFKIKDREISESYEQYLLDNFNLDIELLNKHLKHVKNIDIEQIFNNM